jgi:hypothetical protein
VLRVTFKIDGNHGEVMSSVRNPSVANVLFALEMVIHAGEATVPGGYDDTGNPVQDWQFKFEYIFGNLWPKVLEPRLKDSGLDMPWYDPDSSYEDDVKAFVSAAKEFKEKLEAVAL